MKSAVSYSANTKPLHDLVREGRRHKLPRGQILQSSDDRAMLNLLVSGYVKRYLIGNDGNLGVQYIAGPNYVFPLTPVFKVTLDQIIYTGPEVYYYQCMTPCEIFSIDQDTLQRAVETNSLLYKALFAEAGVRLQDNIQRLENLSLKSAYNRVAHQLVYYARQFGTQQSNGIKLDVPLTHQDLADNLSLTRETVSTCMMRLRKNNLITSDKSIIVINSKQLEEAAYE